MTLLGLKIMISAKTFKTNKNLMMMDEVSGIVDEVQLVGGPQQAARGVKRPA